MHDCPQQRRWLPPEQLPAAGLARTLRSFEGISLKETTGSAALLSRVDTKYVFTEHELPALLEAVRTSYRVLEVDGLRLNPYSTRYFDSPAFTLFQQHQTGRAVRFKIRMRTYVASQLSFLEVKNRTNTGRTVKRRMPWKAQGREGVPLPTTRLEPLLLAPDRLPRSLEEKLTNEYSRATLVSKNRSERVTLDLNLVFSAGNHATPLTGLVIAEVKQERHDRTSEFIMALRRRGLRPGKFSKYCVGVSLLNPTLRQNRFKPILRHTRLLLRGGQA